MLDTDYDTTEQSWACQDMSIRKPNPSADGPQWIAIYVTHNLPEAHVILGKLEANNLPAMIHQEAGASALGITLGNLGRSQDPGCAVGL